MHYTVILYAVVCFFHNALGLGACLSVVQTMVGGYSSIFSRHLHRHNNIPHTQQKHAVGTLWDGVSNTFHSTTKIISYFLYCFACFISQNDWYPLYHTTYETFKDVKLFIDPDFTYHQAVSRYVTELLRSLSDSVIIPYVTRDYAVRLKEIFHSLKQEVSTELAKKNLSLGVQFLLLI